MTNKPIWIAEVNPTPLGSLWVGVTELGLAAVEFADDESEMRALLEGRGYQPVEHDPTRTTQVVDQLLSYLHGKRQEFELPIDWSGMTEFQEQVLRTTFDIPFGEVSTYGQLAAQVGRPGSARAVGRVQATNPMPLVIPCHRVIGSDGKLHGYGGRGGLKTKSWLLNMEAGFGKKETDSKQN